MKVFSRSVGGVGDDRNQPVSVANDNMLSRPHPDVNYRSDSQIVPDWMVLVAYDGRADYDTAVTTGNDVSMTKTSSIDAYPVPFEPLKRTPDCERQGLSE